MRGLIMCLLVFGVFTASKAQTDSVSEEPAFTCYYVDENTFQCDLDESKGLGKDEGLNEGETRKEDPSKDNVFDPENEGTREQQNTEDSEVDITDQPELKDEELYGEPEKESDEGMLDTTGSSDWLKNEDESSVEKDGGKSDEGIHQNKKVY